MRTLDDLDVEGKRVLVRVDFNVPLDEDRDITDDARIRGALPTIEELREQGAAQLVLLAHLGRPKDREPELSLRPVADRLGELLGADVALAPDLDDVPTATSSCSRTSATSRGRRRTTPSWRSATRRSRTSTSTTRSAPRTARTPRPRRSRICCRPPRAACCSARSRR